MQARSRAGCLLGCEITGWCCFKPSILQGEAQILYPKIHENLENSKSTLKALLTNFCHWIKPTIKHYFSVSPFGYFLTKHTYTDSILKDHLGMAYLAKTENVLLNVL